MRINESMLFRIFFVLWVLAAVPALAAAPEVSDYILEPKAGGGVVLRLRLDQMLDFKSFTLQNPDRVVIDITGAKWRVPKKEKPVDNVGFIKKLRAGMPKPETLRVVLDVSQPVKIEDAFIHVPSRKKEPHYLVVQMKPLQPEAQKILPPEIKKPAQPEQKIVQPQPKALPPEQKPIAAKPEEPVDLDLTTPPSFQSPPTPAALAPFVPVPKLKPERFTIVIDPGHGGVDPGTIGAQGTKEKEITLQYAKHLRDLLQASGRYEVVLTRASDTYVPLRTRVKKAQAANGQLFISLHADSHPEENMRGLSVYTLSETASDKEAEALAEQENKKDIITGVDLSHQSKDVAEVLIDLAQRDTKNTSARFAELVVNELGTEAKLLKNTHRFAGFAVLKGVGTPSALVEMGYLSNPTEEAQLLRPDYEDKLVHAIARAVDTYCDQYAPKDQAP